MWKRVFWCVAGGSGLIAGLWFLLRLFDDATYSPSVGIERANQHVVLGQAAQAEQELRKLLSRYPDDSDGQVQLAHLLIREGRASETESLVVAFLHKGVFQPYDLIPFAGDPLTAIDGKFLRECRERNPEDVIPLIGLAKLELAMGNAVGAVEMLRPVVIARPELIEAHAVLGAATAVTEPQTLSTWNGALPPEADRCSDIWLVRGDWAKLTGDDLLAVRCYHTAVIIDPNSAVANYRLGQALEAVSEEEQAAPFLERAKLLRDLFEQVRIIKRTMNPEQMQDVADRLESLGRLTEARGWYRFSALAVPDQEHGMQRMQKLQRLTIDRELVRTVSEQNPAVGLDMTRFPEWQPPSRPPLSHNAMGEDAKDQASFHFEDCAKASGIDFTFFNDDDPTTKGRRILETTGGGVGVIDLDCDAWPDLYFTQGCHYPPADDQTTHIDRIFRNSSDGHFRDVTQSAGLGDNRYSQGIAVADFDNDGFSDIAVANVGANRLYHNNGDGTFSDVTDVGGVGGNAWSTSLVFVDLDNDSMPDLFEVNYLAGEDLHTRFWEHDGKSRVPSPATFHAAEDRIYRNLGDGRFEDQTVGSGIELPLGTGLGILAAPFLNNRIDLFVANDQQANYYFVNESPVGGPLHFAERAVLLGVAYDRNGVPQACMGVAADDVNRDGRLDLFVTNFSDETNTLWLQREASYFEDATYLLKGDASGFHLLGFGTQFLDADLDGRAEIIVTNGHVDDFTFRGQMYEMPPLLLTQDADGGFRAVPNQGLGTYFEENHLGRGLARLDWNRDGRPDVAISHLDAPAALLTNQTPPRGHFLRIHLRGVHSSRDAAGAKLVIEAGETSWTCWLTVGDGYQATNQHAILIGVGAAERIRRVNVYWPSGKEDEYAEIPVDVELLLIEGATAPVIYNP